MYNSSHYSLTALASAHSQILKLAIIEVMGVWDILTDAHVYFPYFFCDFFFHLFLIFS